MGKRVCGVDDCGRKHYSRGWCRTHYDRWTAHGDTRLPERGIPNRIIDGDAISQLVITQRDGTEHVVQFDPADRDLVASRRWSMSDGYAITKLPDGPPHTYSLHRTITGVAPGDPVEIDHRNGDRLDCRRRNLRRSDSRSNAQNRAIVNGTGSSRYRGVSWHRPANAWEARCKIAGRVHYLGYFLVEEHAAAAVARCRAENGALPGY